MVYIAVLYIIGSSIVWYTTAPPEYVDEVPYIENGWQPLVEDC
jgi:hypothetical protein